MSTTTGMKRGGYYDHHSEYQRRVAETGAQLIEECVSAVPLPRGDRAFVIVDYGASTGANSLASLRTAAAAVRVRSPEQPVTAVHNDLPTNDWNELFANLRTQAESYMTVDGPPALPMASAVSFFEPAVPAASAHLGLSFSAAHWLREPPTVLVPQGFYFCEAPDDERAALASQADADWTTFLAARAADLATDGRLLVQMVGSEEVTGGAEPNVTARKLMQAMTAVARDLVADGKLDRASVDEYLLPVYARTPAEARAPLERAGSAVADAFTIETIRTDRVANPYLDQWKATGDADAYGKSYAAFVRGFTESSLRNDLFGPGASGGADVDALIDEYFERLATRFAADPRRDAFEDWTLTAVLTRR